MANTLIADTPFVFVGLGTLTYVIPTTGIYTVRVQSTEIPPSGISILVKDNGSTIFTAPILGQTQSAIQFQYEKLLTATHTLTVVLASSADSDQLINSVKTSVSIGLGN